MVLLRRKKEVPPLPEPAIPDTPLLPEVDARNLEDRILLLLEGSGGRCTSPR